MRLVRPIFLLLLLALPIVSVLLLVVNEQIAISYSTTVRLPITGYDPRNLMYGHYLRFHFAAPTAPDNDTHDYFVPESEANELAKLLGHQNGHRVTLDVNRTGNHVVNYGMLYIDDQPWHDYLAAHQEEASPVESSAVSAPVEPVLECNTHHKIE